MDTTRIIQMLETMREGPAGRTVTYRQRQTGVEVPDLMVVWQDLDSTREAKPELMTDEGGAVVSIIADEMVDPENPEVIIPVNNGDEILGEDGLTYIIKSKRKLAQVYWRVVVMSGEPTERTSRGYRSGL